MDTQDVNSENRYQLHKDYWRKNSPEFKYFMKRILGAVSPKQTDFKRKSVRMTVSNIFTPSNEAFALLFLYNDYDSWLNTTKGTRLKKNSLTSKELETELLKMYQKQNGNCKQQDKEEDEEEKKTEAKILDAQEKALFTNRWTDQLLVGTFLIGKLENILMIVKVSWEPVNNRINGNYNGNEHIIGDSQYKDNHNEITGNYYGKTSNNNDSDNIIKVGNHEVTTCYRNKKNGDHYPTKDKAASMGNCNNIMDMNKGKDKDKKPIGILMDFCCHVHMESSAQPTLGVKCLWYGVLLEQNRIAFYNWFQAMLSLLGIQKWKAPTQDDGEWE
eukprot:jgi/Psemu1/47510/gm1.47510_g